MKIEQIISKGIAANSYFIAADNHAVVIDPRRDVDVYLDLAQKYNVRITAIFDTHRNEDFVKRVRMNYEYSPVKLLDMEYD